MLHSRFKDDKRALDYRGLPDKEFARVSLAPTILTIYSAADPKTRTAS